ncbi:MAG: LamB/YcsF family protein [Clostridia bacterium]|nr:LamB/YcsF family protein [Clostridia bacterium]
MYQVDLNSDLGESFGSYTIGNDASIIPLVSSVNIACGFHAGDPDIMDKTVSFAIQAGTAIGAHPGYPDLQGFGRRLLQMTPQEARNAVVYQVGALQAFLRIHDTALQHIKLHGALYNQAAVSYPLALAICEGLAKAAPDAILLGLAGSQMLRAAQEVGLHTASEVFADRAYQSDGTLVPRTQPGAVLHDPQEAIARTIRMVQEGVVESVDKKTIPIQADSICVHGDNASALAFVKSIRSAFAENQIQVVPLKWVCR